jgi:hypothetical protein
MVGWSAEVYPASVGGLGCGSMTGARHPCIEKSGIDSDLEIDHRFFRKKIDRDRDRD